MLDLLGNALLDYQKGDRLEDVYVETNISEKEILFRSHFFRTFPQMIPLEQSALTMAKGRILDVGAGTGSHVLYLQEKGLDVVALDVSPSAIEVCKCRGVKQTVCADVLEYNGKFDTILMLKWDRYLSEACKNRHIFTKIEITPNSNGADFGYFY